MMQRRDLIALIGGVAVAWPKQMFAQTRNQLPRVSILFPQSEPNPDSRSSVRDFATYLQDLGWSEGHTVSLEYRFAGGDPAKFTASAVEIVGSKPDVIVAISPPAVLAFKQLTNSIPIIFESVGDAVAYGFVENLAKPGANVTGVENFGFAMGGKWIEVLKEIAPMVTNVAFIYHPATTTQGYESYLKSVRAAAPSFGIEVTETPIRDEDDIDIVMETFGRKPNAGLLFPPDPFTIEHRRRIVEGAAHFRLPAVYTFDYFPKSGGLISYSVDPTEQNIVTVRYVDRILRGANPRDLPVQGPTKFQVVINLKTAKALGLTIPPSLLIQADEVIE